MLKAKACCSCCSSEATVSKDAAADALYAKHMRLFVVALMYVATFAVLGMWTTFWPIVWVAVPAALFAMVAAGLIGTAPTALSNDTQRPRAGAIKMCAIASLVLTVISFIAAAGLGGEMVEQARTWDAEMDKAFDCDHDESTNELYDPRYGEMMAMHSGCKSDDDCTGARWCDHNLDYHNKTYGFCTGNVAVCDSYPALPEVPFSWGQRRPARLGFDPPSLEGVGECYAVTACKNDWCWAGRPYPTHVDSPSLEGYACLCSRGSAVATGETITSEVRAAAPPLLPPPLPLGRGKGVDRHGPFGTVLSFQTLVYGGHQ